MLTSSLLSPTSFTQPIYFSLAPPLISFRSFSFPLLSSSLPSRPPFLSLFLPHSACLAVAGQPHTPALPVEHCRRPRGWRWAWGVTVAASRPLRPCSSHLSQHFRRRCCYRFIHLRLSLLFSPSFSLPSFLLFASCYLILLTSVFSFFAMCRISLSLSLHSPAFLTISTFLSIRTPAFSSLIHHLFLPLLSPLRPSPRLPLSFLPILLPILILIAPPPLLLSWGFWGDKRHLNDLFIGSVNKGATGRGGRWGGGDPGS